MKIYVATSWRNDHQPAIVELLRNTGFEVYDFRHPGDPRKDAPGRHSPDGFSWTEIDPYWESWSTEEYVKILKHPLAVGGFHSDMSALEECDVCLLVLPSGRSAHLEAGWAKGAGKKLLILVDIDEPELMYKMADFITDSTNEAIKTLRKWEDERQA